jgi:hypothetical protein
MRDRLSRRPTHVLEYTYTHATVTRHGVRESIPGQGKQCKVREYITGRAHRQANFNTHAPLTTRDNTRRVTHTPYPLPKKLFS